MVAEERERVVGRSPAVAGKGKRPEDAYTNIVYAVGRKANASRAEIARSIVDRTIEGNATTTKILFEVVKDLKEIAGERGGGCDEVLDIASEPAFDGPDGHFTEWWGARKEPEV
jgi:hypothetical protein